MHQSTFDHLKALVTLDLLECCRTWQKHDKRATVLMLKIMIIFSIASKNIYHNMIEKFMPGNDWLEH